MNKLEQTFQHIMDKYGHDVLVVHNDISEVCSCYDPATGSVDRHCPYCFGTGYVAQIKKHRTRYVEANVPESNVFMMNPHTFGETAISAKNYYFYKDVELKEGDLIIEVEWDGIRPVFKGGDIYQVAHINRLRYINGEVNYQQVSVKDQPINKSIRGFQIVKRAGEVQYQLAEGDDYQINDPNKKQDPKDRIQKFDEEDGL